jgi:hypothetical protein
VFILFVVGVGVIRFLILRSGGAPPTIDSGNWLAFADSMLGRGVRSSSIVYPPVVPLLAGALVAVFGLVDGISLLGSLAAAMPAVGIYVALRFLGLRLGAFIPGLLLLGASSVGEATAWGGFPQLIGFGLTPIVLVAVDRWLRSWSNGAALTAGALYALVMAVSHFVALTVAIAIVAMVLMAVASPSCDTWDWRRRARSLAVFVVPLLPLFPLYLTLGKAYFGTEQSITRAGQFAWSELVDQIEFLYRAFPWLWRTAFTAALVAPVLALSRRETPLWRMLSSLLIAVVAMTVLSREGRFLYFMTVVAGFGIALWIEAFSISAVREQVVAAAGTWSRRLTVGSTILLLAVCMWQLQAGLRFFEMQRNHYGVLNPGLVTAIDYVAGNSAPTDVVAIPSLQDAPIGWWTEAITGREVIYGSPLGWLAFDAERERAAVANQIFAPTFPTEEKLAQASAAGISFIVVPTNWVFYEPEAVDLVEDASPWMMVFRNDDAVVLGLGTSS